MDSYNNTSNCFVLRNGIGADNYKFATTKLCTLNHSLFVELSVTNGAGKMLKAPALIQGPAYCNTKRISH